MRLGDLDALFCAFWSRADPFKLVSKVHPSEVWNEAASMTKNMPIVDPETLPLVQELRKRIKTLEYGLDIAQNGEKNLKHQLYLVEQELADVKKRLAKAEQERDAAVNDLRGCAIESCAECMYCLYNTAKSFCENCQDGSNWVYRGQKKED